MHKKSANELEILSTPGKKQEIKRKKIKTSHVRGIGSDEKRRYGTRNWLTRGSQQKTYDGHVDRLEVVTRSFQ